jgi:hypothetical protein
MNEVIMKMINSGDAINAGNGQIGFSQADLLIEFMKYDDKL